VLEDETTQTLENHAIDKIGPLIRRKTLPYQLDQFDIFN
jgi:hypothetical protein